MGVVYRATELRLGRPVALKVVSPAHTDANTHERFEREARLAASIEHPNVIPIYGAGEEEGVLYLIMRQVPGTDLAALLKAEDRLEPSRAATIVAQVASALDAAHAAGLVHRDVKPANILLGEDDHVYLTDFGITRVEDGQTHITDSGGWIGTVDFMSPEHLRSEPTDARSDVYALGCVLHTALTGTPPMHRRTVPATIQAHLNDPIPPPSAHRGVPSSFDEIIARSMAKDPADRYPSAGELGRAALVAGSGSPLHAMETGTPHDGAGPDHELPMTVVAPPEERATVIAPAGPASHQTVVARPQPTVKAPVAGGRPQEVKRRSSRNRRLARGAVVLLVALPIIAYLWAMSRTHEVRTGPLSQAEISATANAFARAYSREDVPAVRRLLATNAERVAPDSRQTGRISVSAEYARQFAGMQVKRYALSNMQVQPGDAGRAEGRYRVTRAGSGPLTGQITMVVVRQQGKPAIRLLASQPQA
jgi:serine/threonine-protein kinase